MAYAIFSKLEVLVEPKIDVHSLKAHSRLACAVATLWMIRTFLFRPYDLSALTRFYSAGHNKEYDNLRALQLWSSRAAGLLTALACAYLVIAPTKTFALDQPIPSYLEPLPRPISLQPYVDFWVQIYGVLDESKAAIHDQQRTDKIYEIVDVPHGKGQAAKQAATAPKIEAYRNALLALGKGQPANNSYRQRARQLWGENASREQLLAAAERLRFQPGHADAFKASLIRAAKLRPFIQRALRQAGVPLELDALPHVESFFRNDEISGAGAAGIWQFTPTIGREYMRVDKLIDERLDPRKAAIAAANLLIHNLEVTGNWPMAVTAYNHGTSGVLRAARILKTPDLGRIARNYTGDNFGFASRNFYAAVLAAADVEANAYQYFGSMELPPPDRLSAHHAPADTPLPTLAKVLDMPLKELIANNLALSKNLTSGKQPIPVGYTLWLDCGDCKNQRAKLTELRDKNPGGYRTIKIKPGDSLSVIAQTHGVRTAKLVALNKLKSANHIRAGQKLKLPWPSSGIEPQGKQLVIPPELMEPIGSSLLDTQELQIQHRLRNPDPYKPSQRFTYRAQLAFAKKLQDQDMVPLQAPGTLYPPADKYIVDSQSTVRLQPDETIDHLAQWLEIDPQGLFLVNNLDKHAIQSINQRVIVVFDSISRAEFERRRKRHHQDKHRRFYAEKEIIGNTEHVMESGDKIWNIAFKRYGVPLWLLLEYNPGLDFRSLRPGDKILLPKLGDRKNG